MMRNPFFRRSRGVALGAVLSACFIADYVSRAAAENWPRFRGPNGSGISRDSRVPVEWNESAGLLWKSAIPGFELFTSGLGKSALCSVRLRGREGTMAPMPGRLGRKDPLDSIAPGLESSDQSQEHTRILDSGNGRTASLRGILGWNSGGAVGL